MYEPFHFRVEDVPALQAFIGRRTLGLLILSREGVLTADPVPFVLDTEEGAFGRLRAHVARANPLWRTADGAEALVVFQGPDHYVSPGWYPSKAETGRVVPTWNYVMAQARGRLTVRDDRDWIAAQARALTDARERGLSPAWSVDDAPAAFMESQMAAVVGIEIMICDLRGKFKLSQNRSAADREGVTAGLAASGGAAEMLAFMTPQEGSGA